MSQMVVYNMYDSLIKLVNFILWKKECEFVMVDDIPTDLQEEQHCVVSYLYRSKHTATECY